MDRHYEIEIARNAKCVPFPMDPVTIGCYGMTAIRKGKMCFTINGTTRLLKTGDIQFNTPGTVRSRFQGDEQTEYITITFSAEPTLDFQISGFLPGAFTGAVSVLLYQIVFQANQKQQDTAVIDSLLNCLLQLLRQQSADSAIHPVVLQMQEYISVNLLSSITVEDVAAFVNRSSSYCNMLFRRETGNSIIQFTQELKVHQACRRLISSDLPISVIAKELAFSDSNYFCRIFKKHTGLTPNQYRGIYRDTNIQNF